MAHPFTTFLEAVCINNALGKNRDFTDAKEKPILQECNMGIQTGNSLAAIGQM